MPPQYAIRDPKFKEVTIESPRQDGYWIEAAKLDPSDLAPGVIVSGLASGRVEFLDNPASVGGSPEIEWPKILVAQFDSPVSIATADITGNGCSDIIVCHNYGPHMLNVDTQGGVISWLKNPGRQNAGEPWEQSYIGQWPSMHRLKAGYFTQRSMLEVIGAPIIRGAHDQGSPAPIFMFQRPSNIDTADEWQRQVVDDQSFTVIHELTVKKFDGPDGLDSLLVSSREGLTWLYFSDGKWCKELIGEGIPKEPSQSATAESPGSGDYWGTGTADVGKVGNDPFAYIATMDPFHGTTLSVYTKIDHGLTTTGWKRSVIDVFGTPTQRLKHGQGPAHYITCADFDGDGIDEILVSIFGPVRADDEFQGNKKPDPLENPQKGLYYYKPLDLKNMIFGKWRVSPTSSARTAVGEFAYRPDPKEKRLDFASISYNVPNYYEEPNPAARLFINEFALPVAASKSIFPSLWSGEVMIDIRNPALYAADYGIEASLSLLELADFEISVSVFAKDTSILIPQNLGLKVLHGSITVYDDNDNVIEVRKPLPLRWTQISDTRTSHRRTKADSKEGAICLWLRPIGSDDGGRWPTAADVPVKTTIDLSTAHLIAPDYKFTKVSDLPWGGPFEGLDFWNMPGFSFRFVEDKTPIAHIQFWAAGKNVDCGIHNHRSDLFGEVHVSLSDGTRDGGMWCAKEEYVHISAEEAQALQPHQFNIRALKPLEEHGSMWVRDRHDKTVKRHNDTLIYPWHKWQAGGGDMMDVWMAVEYDPIWT